MGEADLAGATHFLPVPSIPGDEGWGEKEFEIISEFCLQPIVGSEKNPSQPRKKISNH